MKKRLVVLMMVASMMGTALVGCGNATTHREEANSHAKPLTIEQVADDRDNEVAKDQKEITQVSSNTTTSQRTSQTSSQRTNQNSTKKRIKVQKVNKSMTATKDVNVRSEASTSSSKVGFLKAGEKITCTGICDNGWSRVSYNGKTAYVYSEYLMSTSDAEAAKRQQEQEEARRRAEEEARKQAEEEARRQAEEEARKEAERKTVKEANGTVAEIGDGFITVNENGNQNKYSTASIASDVLASIMVGDQVKVSYTGLQSEGNCVATSIVITQETVQTIVATVVSNNVETHILTIRVDDKTYTINTEKNNQEVVNQLVEGTQIEVTVRGGFSALNTNTVKEIKIVAGGAVEETAQ